MNGAPGGWQASAFAGKNAEIRHSRRGWRRKRSICLTALAILSVMALPVAAARGATGDETWSGGDIASPNWSLGTNWSGGVPPTSAAGTLTFPDLVSCTSLASCYTSNNDLPGTVSATGLVFSHVSGDYSIRGNPLTVGAGGITATAGGVAGAGTEIYPPLVLSGPQTWRVGGSSGFYDGLTLHGGITGANSAALTVPIRDGDLYVAANMEVGPVTKSGPGGVHIGTGPGANHVPGSVNGSSGAPVIINGGSLIANPGSTTGPLTMNTGTDLRLGTNPTNSGASTLQVNGALTLGSGTTTDVFINGDGSTPGIDFSQLTASGSIAVGGQLVLGQGGQGQSNGPCVALAPGHADTLVTTNGTLSGTFDNAPEGAILTMASSCQSSRPRVQIHYTSDSVIATVLDGTSTTLDASPSPAGTNQNVTLTATVAPDNGVPPAGAFGDVAFSADGAPISGCASQPVTSSGSTGTATCSTSFAASGSPASLGAAFTPASGSGLDQSSSPPTALTVNKGVTTTAVAASNASLMAGASVTYTTTVTPGSSGTSRPSGTVQFLDGGTPIAGCDAQPLTTGSPSSAATCTISYPSDGSHSITAIYAGDGNFQSSSAPALTVTVNKGVTTTAVAASNTSPIAGASVTYTTTVTPGSSGTSRPSGTVQFLDGRTPIAGCDAQPLTTGSPSSTATCTISYPNAGSHSITAIYSGDGNLQSSSAPAITVTVTPTPPSASATTMPVTHLGTTQVTLNGNINTGGAAATWNFDYGTSPGYQHTTAKGTIAAGQQGPRPVTLVVKRLSANVRYHYRLVVSTTSQTAYGTQITFTTKPTGQLAGPRARLTVFGRTIRVAQTCNSGVLCRGRFTLTTIARAAQGRNATLGCAGTGFRIRPHRSAVISTNLSRGCLGLLRAQSHRTLTVNYVSQSQTGQQGQRRPITLVLG